MLKIEDILTNRDMNANIKGYLEMRGDNISLYARQRIDELEKALCKIVLNSRIDLLTSEFRIELLNLVINRTEIDF